MNTRSTANQRNNGGQPPAIPKRTSGKYAHQPATSTLSRRSSIAFGKGSQPRADPRPINDKGFQIQCMRTVVEYLTTHGYNVPISPKLPPSGKEIKDMIEFLIREIDPSMRGLGKLEEDVPFFFRMIGYPFQISKSAFYAAGSPHSWPGLLAALTWLVQLLNYKEKAREIRQEEKDEDRTAKTFEYTDLSYAYFMDGDDEGCAALDEQIREQFRQETAQIAEQNEEYAKQIAECKRKLHSLTNQPSPLDELEKKKQDLLSDIGKFNLIIINYAAHKQTMEKKVEERKQELEAKQAEIARITQENDAFKEQVSAQQISAQDYERMLREAHRLEEEFISAVNSRKEREQEAWDLEIQVTRKLKELENAAEKCNRKIGSLKLLPSEAQAEHANPFEVKANPKGETTQEVLGIDFKGFVRPQLTALSEAREISASEMRLEITALRKEVHAKEDALQEKYSANAVQEKKNKKLEIRYKEKKAELEEFLSSKAAECEALKANLGTGEEKLKRQEAEALEQLKRAKMEMEQLAVTYEEDHQQKLGELMLQVESCMHQKEYVHSVIARAKAAKERFEKDVTVSSRRQHQSED